MNRLGEVMRRMGWERAKRRFGGPSPEWCYVRGSKAEQEQRLFVFIDPASGEVSSVGSESDVPEYGSGGGMNGHRSDAFLPVPPTPWAGTRGGTLQTNATPCMMRGARAIRCGLAGPFPRGSRFPHSLHHSRPTPSGPLLFLPLRERGGTEGTDRKKGSGGIESPDSASPLGGHTAGTGRYGPAPLG